MSELSELLAAWLSFGGHKITMDQVGQERGEVDVTFWERGTVKGEYDAAHSVVIIQGDDDFEDCLMEAAREALRVIASLDVDDIIRRSQSP
jgi:hypothetical protein